MSGFGDGGFDLEGLGDLSDPGIADAISGIDAPVPIVTRNGDVLGQIAVPTPIANGNGRPAAPPPSSREDLSAYKENIRGLIQFIELIRTRITTSRDQGYMEMGLRTAHAEEALRFNEPHRARAHVQQIVKASRGIGIKWPKGAKFSSKLIFASATTKRDQAIFVLGFSMSKFEEAITKLDVQTASSLIDRIVSIVEML